jgi:hypothetical protein
MSTTFTWKIANLDRETSTGRVFSVHYVIDAEDGTYRSGAYGSIGLDGEVTTPFADLTEEQCVNWVKDSLGEEKVESILAALQAQLDEQAAPTKASGVPW